MQKAEGFCLTQRAHHPERGGERWVLRQEAVIQPSVPHGLLQGQTAHHTRTRASMGNLKLKRFVIPAPQTISVPIDDLCQFLILGTNGLWGVLDTKSARSPCRLSKHTEKHGVPRGEPTVTTQRACQCPISEQTTARSGNIHTAFQRRSGERGPTGGFENLPVSEHSICDPEVQDHLHQKDHSWSCSEEGPGGPTGVDRQPKASRERHREDPVVRASAAGRCRIRQPRAASNAALEAGSRDNITVMSDTSHGTERQLLT